MRSRFIGVLASVVAFSSAAAQTPAADPSAKLREVLPADVADKVIARIQEARAHQLPAQALENRALKLAANKVTPGNIVVSVNEHAVRLEQSKNALESSRAGAASDDEIEAGAEAMGKGAKGDQVSALAKSAPSGRSLAVPLFVIGSLMDRGLPSDQAIAKVQEKLAARATDRELEELPGSIADTKKPTETGKALANSKRPSDVGKPATAGAPAGVPRNAGAAAAARPSTPPGATKKP